MSRRSRMPFTALAIAALALVALQPATAHALDACEVATALQQTLDGQDEPDARADAARTHVAAFDEAVSMIHNQRLWNYGERLEAHQKALDAALAAADTDAAQAAVAQMRAELVDFLEQECAGWQPTGDKPKEAEVELPTERPEQALLIARALRAGDTAAIDPWLGHYPLPVRFEHSLGEGDTAHRHTTKLADRKAADAWLTRMAPLFQCAPDAQGDVPDDCEWMNGLEVAPVVACGADACCSFSQQAGGELVLAHNTVFIRQICFDVDERSGEALVKSIDFLDGD